MLIISHKWLLNYQIKSWSQHDTVSSQQQAKWTERFKHQVSTGGHLTFSFGKNFVTTDSRTISGETASSASARILLTPITNSLVRLWGRPKSDAFRSTMPHSCDKTCSNNNFMFLIKKPAPLCWQLARLDQDMATHWFRYINQMTQWNATDPVCLGWLLISIPIHAHTD